MSKICIAYTFLQGIQNCASKISQQPGGGQMLKSHENCTLASIRIKLVSYRQKSF